MRRLFSTSKDDLKYLQSELSKIIQDAKNEAEDIKASVIDKSPYKF